MKTLLSILMMSEGLEKSLIQKSKVKKGLEKSKVKKGVGEWESGRVGERITSAQFPIPQSPITNDN